LILDTDVIFGTAFLLHLLPLCGVTSESELLSETNNIRPEYYVDTIADFFAPVKA
jgi:4-nitrophenyl phosphatase/phosphoglycolate phosphatase